MAEQAKASNPDMRDLQPKPAPKETGPKTGDIVLVRQDLQNINPAIVTNGYEGQNTAGVVAVVSFTAAPYGAGPVNMVPNCQPETKETTAEELQSTWQGYYMAVDSPLRARDLNKELADHKAVTNPPAESKAAT